jgi:hypothetical protein
MPPNHRHWLRYRLRYWLRYQLFLSATGGAVLICLASVWLATPSLVPTTATQTPSSRHFQLSPIPPAADWTS